MEVNVPTKVGLNVTVNVELEPAAIVIELIEVANMVEPESVPELTTKAEVPVF